MIELEGTFLDKARESLAGSRAELAAQRYSNSANRSYYAVFQAAIHAILAESIRPPRPDNWDHGWVQSQFNGVLVNRRHRYAPELRSVLGNNYNVRTQADYSPEAVSETSASRALRRAERFVGAIVQREAQS
jgi:uncharacterized protein (UPF0332 family)